MTRDDRKTRPATPSGRVDVIVPRIGAYLLKRLMSLVKQARKLPGRVPRHPALRWGLSARVENARLQADLFWQTIEGPMEKLATVTVTRNINQGRPLLEVAIDPLHFSGAGTEAKGQEEAIEHCISWAWLTIQGEDRRCQP